MKLIELHHVAKCFQKKDRSQQLVLDRINFSIQTGEIVALLGRSGSGKSTLLRMIAGLIPPSSGSILFRGTPITEPVPDIAMVFQNFALLPWLTVLHNVELGLEARGVPRAVRRARALKAIDAVGLDGFESAYPKELSGGMSQRVGLARALVMDPEVLLMDEPFSALDVLTAENLRSDLIRLWRASDTRSPSVLIVTHNIEEAVYLADRILIFANHPASLYFELIPGLSHPRNSESYRFRRFVDDVYRLMTTSMTQILEPNSAIQPIDLAYRLPNADVSETIGLAKTLCAYNNQSRIDLPEIAHGLQLEIDRLFPIVEMLEILNCARVSKGDIELTALGRDLAQADILDSKHIVARSLLRAVPMMGLMRRILEHRSRHKVHESFFLDVLEQHMTSEASRSVLHVLIEWGRYAEILAYDYDSGLLSLENPI